MRDSVAGPVTRPGDTQPADVDFVHRRVRARAAFEDEKLRDLLATGQRFSSRDALAAALAESMTPEDRAELEALNLAPSEDHFLEERSRMWMSDAPVREGRVDWRPLWAPDVPATGISMFPEPEDSPPTR